jgi:ubiquinone/menaquinone biosynthesis C-methylase UbiE
MAQPDLKFFTDGEAYERLMGQWSRPVARQFLDWLGLPQGRRWLDVGCGTGAFTETVIARCAPAEIQGIDPSDAQIAYARSREAAKLATFQVGDAQALPFDDAQFDVAAMALVISFIADPSKAVAEMVRVVRPGGCVATYIWDMNGGGLPPAPFQAAVKALGFDGGPVNPNAEVTRMESLQALWTRAGLEDVETRRIDIQVSFADLEDFWTSNTVLPSPAVRFLRDLGPADVERVKRWLDESLPRDAANRISYPAWANAVKGRKPAR